MGRLPEYCRVSEDRTSSNKRPRQDALYTYVLERGNHVLEIVVVLLRVVDELGEVLNGKQSAAQTLLVGVGGWRVLD